MFFSLAFLIPQVNTHRMAIFTFQFSNLRLSEYRRKLAFSLLSDSRFKRSLIFNFQFSIFNSQFSIFIALIIRPHLSPSRLAEKKRSLFRYVQTPAT